LAVLTGGRRDAAGQPTWLHARDYLRPAERFIGRPADPQILDGAEGGRLVLISADVLNLSADGQGEVLLTFNSPATASGGTENVLISPGSNGSNSEKELIIKRSGGNQFAHEIVSLPSGTEKVKALNKATNAVDIVRVSSFAEGWTTKTIRVLGPENWQRTIDRLTNPPNPTVTDPTAGWWLRLASKRLFGKGGLLPAGTQVKFDQKAVAGDLVIDGRSDAGVLLYCASTDSPPERPALRTPAAPAEPFAIWTHQAAADRIFGLSNMEVPEAALSAADYPSQAVEAFAATTKGLRLLDGQPPRQPRSDRVLLAAMPDPRQPHRRSILWLGLRPESVGLTAPLGVSWNNEMRAASFWVGLIDAAQLCPHPVPIGPRLPDDGQRPIVLLKSIDVEQMAAERYASGAVVVAVSILMALLWSLFHSWIRRK
jgi:hypothetical protein